MINVATPALIQRGTRNVKLITSSRLRYRTISTTLCQLCEERQMWIIHGNIVAYAQPCLKVVKKFNNNIAFVSYSGSIL